MRLAKPHLDVGFMTEDWEAAERFWGDDVGLAYEEFLKIGAGVRQHRFGCHGSVVKVNHSRERLPASPSIYRSLRISSDRVDRPLALAHPDGVPVTLVPPGFDGIVGLELTVATADVAASRRFWVEGLGGEDLATIDNGAGAVVRVGDSVVRLEATPGLAPMTDRNGRGLRYVTVQVFDVDAEHARLVELGFAEEWAPTTLGTTARISFVRDPDGGFVEISQRASLTGPLPGA